MKRCPTCNRTYTDNSLNFCLEDGTPLATDAPPGPDPNATIRYPSARDTAEPPPTEIYRTELVGTPRPSSIPPPPPGPPPPPPPPQWTPTPAYPPKKKSNAIWWILGGLIAFMVIGVGIVVMLIALASLGSNSNTANLNANRGDVNRNSNVTANVNANANANVEVPPSSPLLDGFNEKKWGVGLSQYGRTWYEDDEYHMTSKEHTYIVMSAPSDDYNTENATVKVTARSVDGSVPSAGFGLMVHCGWSKTKQLEDYALLIYPSDEPEYEVVMHKDGTQSSLVQKTRSDAIQSDTHPNRLEIRIKGTELSFYVNGQFLTRVTDTANFRRGRAGFYTSDEIDVAFDDLEIDR